MLRKSIDNKTERLVRSTSWSSTRFQTHSTRFSVYFAVALRTFCVMPKNFGHFLCNPDACSWHVVVLRSENVMGIEYLKLWKNSNVLCNDNNSHKNFFVLSVIQFFSSTANGYLSFISLVIDYFMLLEQKIKIFIILIIVTQIEQSQRVTLK